MAENGWLLLGRTISLGQRMARKSTASRFDTVTFDDLERFARRLGVRRVGRAVGGPLRAFYIKHPNRVKVVRGATINGSRPIVKTDASESKRRVTTGASESEGRGKDEPS
jgi:hypothetical protein